MHHLSGTGAGSGIVVGAARLLPPRIQVEERSIAADYIVTELQRFEAAIVSTDAAMADISNDGIASCEAGSDLINTHREILKSDEIIDEARRLIRERSIGAEWAVRVVLDQMRPLFAQMKDARFAARFGDVEAVADRLLRSLLDLPEIRLDERLVGAIGIGFELSPLDALQLHRLGIAGFATERGGPTSHEAIIARELGIPYVFGVKGLVKLVGSGDIVCVDGTHGEVIVRPSERTIRDFEVRRLHDAGRFRAVEAAGRAPSLTLDGTAFQVGANVQSATEVALAVAAGADHIGLVRTELLYLDRRELPSEEEQLKDAIEIIKAAAGRPVTFRTLDLGGDKLPIAVRIPVGPNPALGLRGIRFSLRRHDLFCTQLRALYRAAAVGPLRIMFPLVSSVTEIREARILCKKECDALAAAGIAHDPKTLIGAMIETPSAVFTADHIAAECDFLSIGTNDLIQYAFAADRENEEMAYLHQPLHPSILRALQQVFSAAKGMRGAVSVCGDMAGDPAYAWALLGLGLRTFSMTTRELPFVKSVLRKSELAEAQQFVRQALHLTSPQDIEALVLTHLGERFSLELEGHAGRPRSIGAVLI